MLTLGVMLRAARLGWRMTPNGYLLRISDTEDGRFRLDFHPPSIVPARDKLKGPHRVWWERRNNTESSITDFAPICYIKTVKRRFTLYVDDDGRAA